MKDRMRWNIRLARWIRRRIFRVPQGAVAPPLCLFIKAVLQPVAWLCWRAQEWAPCRVEVDFLRDMIVFNSSKERRYLTMEVAEQLAKEYGIPEKDIPV